MSRVGREYVRIGQGLTLSALRIDAARPARAVFDPARERPLGDADVSIRDPNTPRPSPSMVEAALRISAALDRFGIPYGRAQVTHPRGVQIWSHPQGEHRPGTNIPLMERVVTLPQGTILAVTPDPRIIERALETPEGFGMAFYSYRARWNLRDADQPFSVGAFERLGVPAAFVAGEGYIAGSMANRLLPLQRRRQRVLT